MASNFEPNPGFLPDVERAVLREMNTDVREQVYQDVRSRLAPSSIAGKVTVKTAPARRINRREVGVFIGYGRGLGPIFEGGTKQRFTKGKGKKQKYPAGVNRGQITTANYAMTKARDAAVRRGLSFRYLS